MTCIYIVHVYNTTLLYVKTDTFAGKTIEIFSKKTLSA